jgi:hypothetical protein
VSCKGWETGAGAITMESQSDPPYLDSDPSFSEEFVNFFLNHALTAKVDSKIRAAMRDAGSGPSTSGTGFNCNTLGVDHGMAGDMDDSILWAQVPVFNSLLAPQITVRPIKIKRLPARDYYNAVLYDAMEAPFLEMYAGFSHSVFQLPSMVDGQEVFLSGMPSMTIRRPATSSSLVVIASLNYLNKPVIDSNFRVFSSAVNFGIGTQTVVINKTFWKPATPGTKPIKFLVPGYEITFQVEQSGIAPAPGGGVIQPVTSQPVLPVLLR